MSFDTNKPEEDSFALDVDEKNIWEKLMQGGDDEEGNEEKEEEEEEEEEVKESLKKKLDEKLTKTLEDQKMESGSEKEEGEENADMNEFEAEFNSFMDLARKNLETTDSVESKDKTDTKNSKSQNNDEEKKEDEEEDEDDGVERVNPFSSTEAEENGEKRKKEKDEDKDIEEEKEDDDEGPKKNENKETKKSKEEDVKIDFNAEDFSLEKILKDVDSEIEKNEKIFDDDEDGGDDKALAIGNQDEDFFNTAEGGSMDEGFADFDNFETKVKKAGSEESIVSEEEEVLDELPPFNPPWDYNQGWSFLLRQPLKKKFTQNRFWKPAYVRIEHKAGVPTIRIFPNDKDTECLFELELQITHTVCNVGLQQLDQFGKCHTVKIQQCNFKETIGLKSDRIAPTLMDLTKVRDLKGLKDLMHKPKTTMLLDHAHSPIELLKFGTTKYEDIKSFIYAIEDILFNLNTIRGKSASYTKDEIEIEVRDEYYAEIDSDGHILNHKARVRLFCLAFLSESPTIEIGINDKRRRGKEVVSRIEIIPIKTEEWIKIENYELHNLIEKEEFEKTKVLKLNPLDACKFEILRFRTRPRINIELPLQIRAQMTIIDRHIEARVEVMVTGYYSHSSRAAQTPCENIQIRFPIPESWVYLFRVEKRFKYGAVHSAKRKAGKIKGIERITGFAQGNLPPSLIEVTSGLAKYEQAFHALVWRIDQLPERNEGAYKTHLMTMNLELAAHDEFPEELAKTITVEYSMLNSTVSKAQVRSIAINSSAEDPPDRWVKHAAKFEYIVGIEFTDKPKPQSEDIMSSFQQEKPKIEETKEEEKKKEEEEEDSSSSDSD